MTTTPKPPSTKNYGIHDVLAAFLEPGLDRLHCPFNGNTIPPDSRTASKPARALNTCRKSSCARSLKREVVLVAHTTVIEAQQHLGERQEPVVLDGNAHSGAPEYGRDGRAGEVIEAGFADDRDQWHVTIDRAGHVEMRPSIAVVSGLVVRHVDIGGECCGVGTC